MDVFVLGSYVNANSLMVRRLPHAGESVSADSLWVEHGGKGLNLATGMHRLGLRTHTLLAVGEDAPGQALTRLLQAEGMDTRWIIPTSTPSGFGIGLVAADGNNMIAVYPGANARLDAPHVQAASDTLANCQLVCAQFEIPDAPILQAFQLAHQYQRCTLLTPSPWRQPGADLLALTDILVINEPEALALFELTAEADSSIPAWLARLPTLAWSGNWLVVTLAERGCVGWQAGHDPLHSPAWAITAVDPTGAGDAFTAGLAWAWLKGHALAQALPLANACGAMVAAQQGVLPALPTQPQLQKFMSGDAFSG